MSRRANSKARNFFNSSAAVRRAVLQQHGSMIDALEPRRMLSAVINGSAGDDTFIVSVNGNNTINLLFNGVPDTVAAPGVGRGDINGLWGNDTIVLLNSGTIL